MSGGESTVVATATATADETETTSVPSCAGTRSESGSLTLVVCWMLALWLLMIPVRAQVMGFGWYWLQSPVQLGWMVLAGSYLDLLYVLGLGTTFLLAIKLSRAKWQRAVARGAFIFACAASLLLALANIQIVAMVGHPLTYSWLYYSGFLRSYDAQKALAAGLSWDVVLGAGACVLAMVILARFSRWCSQRLGRLNWWRKWAPLAASLLVLAYLAFSAHATRDFHRPSLQNPAVVLAGSFFKGSDNRLFSVETSMSVADYEAQEPTRPPAGEPKVRNVLVIVLESVAAGYLPAYGGDRPITPCLDGYRKQARIYRNIYAHAPATNKSLVSLLCSMYPWPTYRFLTQEYPNAAVVSLSDVLKERGYRTALLSAADLRFGDAEGFLSHHRFDTVQDHRTLAQGRGVRSSEPGHLEGTSDARVCRAMAKWIEQDPSKPFFAMLWTNQTHYPYFVNSAAQGVASQRDVRDELLERYREALRETDAAIGQLLGELSRLGLDESTLVVVVGDHGEAFGQHGRFGHGNTVRELQGQPGGFGHGTALYEENIHVPMLLINPRLFAGEEDTTLGGLVDVGPTVLELLRVPTPEGWQGRSLMNPTNRERVFFAAPWSGAVFGYRQGGRKYLFDAVSNSYKVFDLAADPGEQHDLAANCPPEQLDEAYKHLAAWVQYQERLIQGVAANH